MGTSKKAVKQIKKYDKCLINIWCGCGKTRIIVYKIFNNKKIFFIKSII